MNNFNIYQIYAKLKPQDEDTSIKEFLTQDQNNLFIKDISENDQIMVNNILIHIYKIYQYPKIILDNYVSIIEKKSERIFINTLKKNIDIKLSSNKYKNNEKLIKKSGIIDNVYRYIQLICLFIKNKKEISFIDEKLKIISVLLSDKKIIEEEIELKHFFIF